MVAPHDKTDYRDTPKPLFRLYVPMAAAVLVSISSFAMLTAYDKPLDRQALTPSVMEFIDVNAEAPTAAVPAPAQPPKAHAMLLRYNLVASTADKPQWHLEDPGQAASRVTKANLHPALL